MSSEEGPNEFTVIMKVLEIMDRSLQKASSREINQEQRAQFVQIVGRISNSTFEGPLAASAQGDVVGDRYTVGQAGAVGPNSRAENIQFQQIWLQNSSDLDISQLADELKALRGHLRQSADTLQQDEAVAEVSKAQAAAVEGDGPGVMRHLKQAGKWALDGATAIGTAVAAAAIKAAIGI